MQNFLFVSAKAFILPGNLEGAQQSQFANFSFITLLQFLYLGFSLLKKKEKNIRKDTRFL